MQRRRFQLPCAEADAKHAVQPAYCISSNLNVTATGRKAISLQLAGICQLQWSRCPNTGRRCRQHCFAQPPCLSSSIHRGQPAATGNIALLQHLQVPQAPHLLCPIMCCILQACSLQACSDNPKCWPGCKPMPLHGNPYQPTAQPQPCLRRRVFCCAGCATVQKGYRRCNATGTWAAGWQAAKRRRAGFSISWRRHCPQLETPASLRSFASCRCRFSSASLADCAPVGSPSASVAKSSRNLRI